MTERVIESLEELKQLASRDGGIDCHIRLNFGLRSSKRISYNAGDGWYVYNESDDTEDECHSDEELSQRTNIVEALSKNALILEEY